MHLYQIGRVVEPWTNFRPPIQGGIFQVQPDSDDSEVSDDDLSDASTINALSATSSVSEESFDEGCRRRRDGQSSTKSPKDSAWSQAYVAKLMQGEVDDNVRDYPSLDADTQRSIDLKFQALHQRVKDEGYYVCHFSEYMKELSRYAFLFACFLVTLRTGWYLTSAACLGLFWVCTCFPRFSTREQHLTDHSIK